MLGVTGLLVVFVAIFGGFLLAGGQFEVILHSLPYEMMVIMGGAAGAFMIANSRATVRQTMTDLRKIFVGAQWKPQDYRDLLSLLFELIRLARADIIALEDHIETPATSSIFARYPRVQADKHAVALICDTLRSASMNYDDPNQVEDVLEKRMDGLKHHSLQSSKALKSMAEGLPALGIIAAVLGIIKTMSAMDQPPEVFGRMISGALVGTFLGIFLSYGVVGPFAARLMRVAEEDAHFYQLIREVLVANLHNHSVNLCIEVGRQNTPAHIRPSFAAVEEVLAVARMNAA